MRMQWLARFMHKVAERQAELDLQLLKVELKAVRDGRELLSPVRAAHPCVVL